MARKPPRVLRPARKPAVRPHTFLTHRPGAREVRLVGSFNCWDPAAAPMRRDANGIFTVTLELQPGRHEYKFLVDGEWHCQEPCEGDHAGCPHCVPNAFGTRNCVVVMT